MTFEVLYRHKKETTQKTLEAISRPNPH